jgi:hypothetical protein
MQQQQVGIRGGVNGFGLASVQLGAVRVAHGRFRVQMRG